MRVTPWRRHFQLHDSDVSPRNANAYSKARARSTPRTTPSSSRQLCRYLAPSSSALAINDASVTTATISTCDSSLVQHECVSGWSAARQSARCESADHPRPDPAFADSAKSHGISVSMTIVTNSPMGGSEARYAAFLPSPSATTSKMRRYPSLRADQPAASPCPSPLSLASAAASLRPLPPPAQTHRRPASTQTGTARPVSAPRSQRLAQIKPTNQPHIAQQAFQSPHRARP